MRPASTALHAALLCLALAGPGGAAPTADWSARIKADGLAKTEAALSAIAAPTPDDLFALGAVHFLRGVEGALQLRWSVGATGALAPIPLLRIALPDNPAPQPFRASLISEIFGGILTEMAKSSEAVGRIGDDAGVGLAIRLDDLWFDIDGNGAQGAGEALMPLALAALVNPWDLPETPAPAPAIRFDTADAAWLSAYSHLLSALAEFVLAYDPTAAIAQVTAAAGDKRSRLGRMPSTADMFIGSDGEVDKAMMAILALRQQPDPARTGAVKSQLLAMIADNRTFWNRVAAETDNDAEWLPNDRQTSAFGITLPQGTGARWLGVLAELQAMLEGKLLVPHWALPAGSGIDVGAFLDKPSPLEVIGWVHGIDALPYARQGAAVSGQSWAAFSSVIVGDSLLYALYLN